VNVIACKWVFKAKSVKNDADLNITKYKSRLVAKGYSQIHGVDYEETFAPVVKFTSIRVLLALVSHFVLILSCTKWTLLLKLALNQMAMTCSDVTTIDGSDVQQMSQMADLNGSDSVSMSPPPPSSSRPLVSVF
jgi:hypothetical protein